MNKLVIAAAMGVLLAAPAISPALAQAPAAAPAAKPAAGKINFATSKISEIAKDAKAKAILEEALPPIADYYDQIGDMTLTDIAPQTGGMLDDAKIKEMQTKYDKG